MNKFKIGSLVKNFGQVGRVVGYHEAFGKPTGDLILQGHGISIGGMKWIADPDKCEPFEPYTTETILKHKDALI